MATSSSALHQAGRTGVVSVIVPAYNVERFIHKAIASVLEQTYPAVEIVVVNDGSTDRTVEIVEREFTGKVTLVSQTNGGLANARNTGIRHATGEFAAFLDADDWWDPRKLEVQVKSLRDHADAAANYTGLAVVVAATGERGDAPPVDPNTLWPRLRWCNPGIPPSSVMMRMDVLRRLGGFTEGLRACEDWDLWFKVVRTGRFVVTEEPLTYYWFSPGGLSGDPDRMYASFMDILDPLLLDGFTGLQRKLWRRRIRSYQAYKSMLTARGAGLKERERAYLWMSLREWPSPFWATERWRAFAATLLKG
jgi:glycosyltransferase involved in cell wall biosynthesis